MMYRQPAEAVEERVYWANETDLRKLASSIGERIDAFVLDCETSGRLDRWKRILRMLNGRDGLGKTSANVQFGGQQDELLLLRANMIRYLHKATHVLVTGSRPSMSTRSIASDARATEEVETGNALVDCYMGKGGAEDIAARVAWYAPACGDAWMDVRWDNFATPRLSADMSSFKPSGDVTYRVLRADQVIRDTTATTVDDLIWVVISTRQNRWELAERFPSFRKEILSATDNQKRVLIDQTIVGGQQDRVRDTGDFVTCYELFHSATLACPEGRYAMLIGDTIVSECPNPYREIPCVPMVPSSEPESPYGYGDLWDLMALQQAVDSIISMMVSIQENYGSQNVWIQSGGAGVPGQPQGVAAFRATMVGRGFRAIESPFKPEPLDLVGDGVANSVSAMEFLGQLMQRFMGTNDAALGDASKSQSGAALAMLHSLSLQYNSALQRSYALLLERAMTATLRRLQMFATEERLIEVTGRLKANTVRRFKASDIQSLRGVDVELGSAIMRTSAGRKEIADKLLQAKVITQEQYLEIQATGRLEPVTDRPLSQRVLIETENEAFKEMAKSAEQAAQGVMPEKPPMMPRAMVTDDHAAHIAEHTTCLNDPDVRANNNIAGPLLSHIMKHVNLWQGATMTTPAVLAATGQQPCPLPPPPPGMMPPGPGVQVPGADAQPGADGQMNPGNPAGAPEPLPQGQPPIPNDPAMAAQGPEMPNVPSIPMM